MTRTTIEYKSNNNQQNAQVIEQILFNHAYYQVGYFNETCYQEAIRGIWTHKYITYFFEGDTLVIQGWITSNPGQGIRLQEYSLNDIVEVTLKNSLIKTLMDIEGNINGLKINEYDGDNQRALMAINSQQSNFNQIQNQQVPQQNQPYISQDVNQQQRQNIQSQQSNNLTKDAFQRLNASNDFHEEISSDKAGEDDSDDAVVDVQEEISEDKTMNDNSGDAVVDAENEKIDDEEYMKKLLEEDIDLKNSIAIVFNKEKLDDDFQSEALRICQENFDFKKAGSFCIYAGDKKDENYSGYSPEYCLGFKLADTQTVKYIRESMIKASDKGLVSLKNRFIYEDDLDSQYLIYSGYVANGELNLKS